MTEPLDEPGREPASRRRLGSLLGEVAASAHGRTLGFVLAAFEHLLRQQQWARDRLKSHAGATLRLGIDAPPIAGLPPPEWRVTIDDEGFLRRADPGAVPAVTLLLRPSVDALFAALRSGADGVSRHLRIEGDVMLAGTMGELARHLRWEPAEDLSRIVGDVAAQRIVRAAGEGLGQFRDLGRRAEFAASRFLVGGQQQLATKPLAIWLRDSAASLEKRVDVLEARVRRLAGTR